MSFSVISIEPRLRQPTHQSEYCECPPVAPSTQSVPQCICCGTTPLYTCSTSAASTAQGCVSRRKDRLPLPTDSIHVNVRSESCWQSQRRPSLPEEQRKHHWDRASSACVPSRWKERTRRPWRTSCPMPRPTGAIKRKWDSAAMVERKWDSAAMAERKWDSAGNTARCSALRRSGLQRCTRWSAACTVLQHAVLRCDTINALAAPCLQRVGDGRRLVRDVRDHACAVPAKGKPYYCGHCSAQASGCAAAWWALSP
jgi:hypothetical protein